MTRIETQWAVRALDAMAPPLDGAPRPSEIGADRFVEEFIRGQGFGLGLGLRFVLLLFHLGPLFVVGRPRLFHNLREAPRDRYLDRWYMSRIYTIRQLAIALKSLLCIHWAGHPAVQRRLGYVKANAEPAVDSPT